MAGTVLKWLIPGLLTVVAGTALAISQTGAAISTDLEGRATSALDPASFAWARLDVEGRDVVISGTATTKAMIDDAVGRLASIRGVRAVESRVALAEVMSPFAFSAKVEGGSVTLRGAYPDEAVHSTLLAAAGEARDETRLASGAPDSFQAGAMFALAAAKLLDSGEVSLADRTVSISGRAKSAKAFDALQTLRPSLPAGLEVAALSVKPPVASPYEWTARFDGTTVAIAGDTPVSDLSDRLRALAPANVPISTSLQLASGEPSGFADNTLVLLESLLLLERGKVSIKDGAIALSGAPATTEIADRVTAAVTKLGGTVTLEPPRIAEFSLNVQKVGGKLVFSGFVPDAATRDRLVALPGADADKLVLGRGAPERFDSAIEFGLAALAHLEQGDFGIKAERLSIGGRATTIADFKALLELLKQGAPQGLSLATAEVRPPVAAPFVWSATKDGAGKVSLAGYVPDEKLRDAQHELIADLAADTTELADGAPDSFAASVQKGLGVLALFDSGSLVFNGSSWALEGVVDSPMKGFAADAAYSIAGLRTAGWSYDVHLPETAAPPSLPTITPFVWRAQKSSGAPINLSGFVPSDAFQRVVRTRLPGAADSTILGAGAPADFGSSALAGLDALESLDEGSLSLNGTRWSLTGGTSSAAQREAIQTALSARINLSDWQIAIQARDAAPVVTPYLWSATKSDDGSIELTGYVPDVALKSEAAAAAGAVGRDSMTIASGDPAGFAEDLRAGLAALTHLRNGRAAYDGSKWSLTGDVASEADGYAAIAALAKGSRGGALWSNLLTGYPAAASSEPSSASPASSALSSAPDVLSLEASSAESSAASSSSSEMPSSEPATEPPSSAPSSDQPASEVDAVSSEAEQQNREIAPTNLEILPPMPGNLVFSATKEQGAVIALKGAVPADAAGKYFATLAGGAATDGLVVTANLPADFITNAIAGIESLAELSKGHLGFDGERWYLRGSVDQQPSKEEIVAKISALPNGTLWSVGLDLTPPIDVCRARVDALAQRNAIVFLAGKATLSNSSLPVLDELAGDLEICPAAFIHVQGHTDADGAEDVNLALSVARAEAVVTALIERGVADNRLYAEGYGESDPLVANDTKENKQRNRRIAFEIDEK